MVVNAKITNIEFDKLSVSLECKKEEMSEEEAKAWISEEYKSYFTVIIDKDFRSRSSLSR